MNKIKMTPADHCVIFHTWEIKKDDGLTVYSECKDCGARKAKQLKEDNEYINFRWVVGLDEKL